MSKVKKVNDYGEETKTQNDILEFQIIGKKTG